ncbi:MAG: amino acid ABC transporter substrate-binding protein [Chloroflexota bacterium]|nr:MAG: amino acid ABC transporter substrate-binding protein [Chloroflexota bacterium]
MRLILSGSLLCLLMVSCSAKQSTWQRIQDSGKLRVGLDPTYPPFEFADPESVQGIDVDLAEAIAAALGLEASFTYFGYDGLYDALGTEQVDVLISALVVEPARTRDFAYSDGYVNSGLVIVTRSEARLTQIGDLAGKTVSVELGAAGHVESTTWQRQIPDLAVAPKQSSEEALTDMLDGEVDAAVVDNITARLFAGQQLDDEVHLAPLSEEPYVMVVRRTDGQLLRELNHALDSVRSSGRLDVILDSWYQG